MYLKVKLDATPRNGDPNRDYFTIMEGVRKGQKASVSKMKVKANCKTTLFIEHGCQIRHDSRLLKNISVNGPCLVRYRKVAAVTAGYNAETERTQLEVGLLNSGVFQPMIGDLDVIHQFDLLNPGRYKLKVPGYEHVKKGQRYLGESAFATTWYKIVEPLYKDHPLTDMDEIGQMARYFHPGQGSAGCLTIRSRLRWSDVVKFVSRCRLDDQHVGYVDILPEEKNENR